MRALKQHVFVLKNEQKFVFKFALLTEIIVFFLDNVTFTYKIQYLTRVYLTKNALG